MSEKKTRQCPRICRLCGRFPCISLSITILIILFDCFGLYSSTLKVTEDAIFRISAIWNAQPQDTPLTVVVVDDESARYLNGSDGYPIPFLSHGQVLSTALCAGPSSVFVDFNFRSLRLRERQSTDPSTNPEEFEDFVEMLRQRPGRDASCPVLRLGDLVSVQNPTIFQARLRSEGGKCDPFFDDTLTPECRAARIINSLRRVVSPISVRRRDDDGTYRLATSDVGTRTSLESSPALAMVLKFCRDVPDAANRYPGCQQQASLEKLLQLEPDDPKLRMIPEWRFYRSVAKIKDERAYQPAGNQARRESGCPTVQDPRTQSRWSLTIRELANVVFKSAVPDTITRFGKGLCLPYDTFSAKEIIEISTRCQEKSECLRRKAASLTQRLVFYGGHITAINDQVYSPVLGMVPGVALHAAVADTLLRTGVFYMRNPPIAFKLGSWSVTWGQLFDFALILIGILIIFMLGLLLTSGLRCRVIQFFSLIGLFVVTVTIQAHWLHWPPSNWLMAISLLVAVWQLSTTRPQKLN